jgi:hypothetical protein
MQIGMAILAFDRRVAENQSLVTIGALHFCVPAAQCEFRVGVVELDVGAQGLPGLCCMTFLTFNLELVAVGTMKRRV